MNILQINASDNSSSGASRVMLDLCKNLEKRGHEVNIFTGTHFKHERNFYQIKNNKFLKLFSYLSANDVDYFSSDNILNTDQFKKADIIHCHNLHGWYFNLETLRKMSELKPVVWTLHDMWAITPHCCHTFKDEKIENGFYQCASKNIYPSLLWHNEKYLSERKAGVYNRSKFSVVAPSHWILEKVKRSILGTKDSYLIHNGVDVETFKRFNQQQAREELQLPKNKKIILFLSGGGKDGYFFKGGKSLEKVADNYKNNDEVFFICVGAQKEIKKEFKNVRYVGQIVDKNLLAKYYSASNLLLFLSIAENFPLVILEAMSCGLPIVSFDVGGVKEAVINNQNGYVVHYGSVSGIIEAINNLFNLGLSDIDKMAQDSILSVNKNFSVDKMADKYLDLYQTIL